MIIENPEKETLLKIANLIEKKNLELAYKDISYTKLPRIMKQLKKFDLYKSVKAENLEIMEITQAGEKTINKIKLV